MKNVVKSLNVRYTSGMTPVIFGEDEEGNVLIFRLAASGPFTFDDEWKPTTAYDYIGSYPLGRAIEIYLNDTVEIADRGISEAQEKIDAIKLKWEQTKSEIVPRGTKENEG